MNWWIPLTLGAFVLGVLTGVMLMCLLAIASQPDHESS